MELIRIATLKGLQVRIVTIGHEVGVLVYIMFNLICIYDYT